MVSLLVPDLATEIRYRAAALVVELLPVVGALLEVVLLVGVPLRVAARVLPFREVPLVLYVEAVAALEGGYAVLRGRVERSTVMVLKTVRFRMFGSVRSFRVERRLSKLIGFPENNAFFISEFSSRLQLQVWTKDRKSVNN